MEYSIRFFNAIEKIDAINAQDPRLEQGVPQELLYSKRMSDWLLRLDPHAAEALQLAARAQHICRWQIERSAFPLGPVGYRQWRNALTRLHVEKTGEILSAVGYDDSTVIRVQSLMRKERLKLDVESQMLEDVVCLVFLENYFASFSIKHETEKVIDILRKTWAKMSERAQSEALRLPMSSVARDLVGTALAA